MSARLRWLTAGMLVGGALAIAGAVRTPRDRAIGEDAIAVVDGASIDADRYRRALARRWVGRRTGAVDRRERERLADALIDEELLVQRAETLGLHRLDPLARRHLLRAMHDMIAARAEEAPISDADLRELFAAEPERWTHAATYALTTLFFRGRTKVAQQRAETARRALGRGIEAELVRRRWADEPAWSLPAGRVSLKTLRQHLGGTAAAGLATLEPGGVSEPLGVPGGYVVLRFDASEAGAPRSFAEARGEVLALARKQRREAELSKYLADLRRSAAIAVNGVLLDQPRPPERMLTEALLPDAEGRR